MIKKLSVVDAVFQIMIQNGNALTVIIDGENEMMTDTPFEVDANNSFDYDQGFNLDEVYG